MKFGKWCEDIWLFWKSVRESFYDVWRKCVKLKVNCFIYRLMNLRLV